MIINWEIPLKKRYQPSPARRQPPLLMVPHHHHPHPPRRRARLLYTRTEPVQTCELRCETMNNNDAACWGAFGSDTDDSDGDCAHSSTRNQKHELELAAESVSMAATQHFAQLIKSSGVPVKERIVAVSKNSATEWEEILQDKLADRGYTSVIVSGKSEFKPMSDAAVLFHTNEEKDRDDYLSIESFTRKSVIPGGVLWIVASQGSLSLENLSAQVWDVGSAITTQPSPNYTVTKIQKRACTINTWSCPWMDKHSVIPEHVASDKIGLDIRKNETYLEYEQRVVSDLTICPSVAERTTNRRPTLSGDTSFITALESAHVEQAVKILRQHGFVIIKGLLPPDQTLPYGEALLADFQSAIDRLKGNQKRPVNILNPRQVDEDRTKQIFEPLSYREMSMREDLRVDLRSGPALKKLADSHHASHLHLKNNNNSHMTPVTIDSFTTGSLEHFRIHPSLIAILKALFNPVDDTLSRGNFGRWNFGNSGPDGTPQPFRIGPIGAVISCPGSGDQAIHADTPHLFENINCLPCHYCNIFTPGFEIVPDQDHGCFKHEFDSDGVWTGNTTMGGTALVNGSHKLNVTATLVGEEDSMDSSELLRRRKLLQLQTIRPALDVGDVLIFDNRCLHYGLANNSNSDKTGGNVNAGRRPMLYLNVTQSWFHDPKNWDDRESIFDDDDNND